MILQKFKSNIVSHLSYFLGSDGEAAVVDPELDCQIYLDSAEQGQMKIKYVFETHRNEDFIVGSKALSDSTGAAICHGSWPEYKYGELVNDGQEFEVGDLLVKALYTPGHTPGCISYAVTDLESGNENVLVFTGDALFVNEVGRTDFGGLEKKREWSENLYDSIFNRLLPLGDHVIICPAHGAGSICGSDIAQREFSTLGAERLMNPRLQLSREEFIEYKLKERHNYPPYFRLMEEYNIVGTTSIGPCESYESLVPQEFKNMVNEGAAVLDTRSASAFSSAHIAGSYSIPLSHLSFTGWFISHETPVLTIVEDVLHLKEVSELERIGYDDLHGYLAGGMASWYSQGYPTESSRIIDADELKSWLDSEKDFYLLDVRSKDEFQRGHIQSATNIPVTDLQDRVSEVPKDQPIAAICSSGNRSGIGAKILLRNGYKDVYNVAGGMTAWRKLGYPVLK